MRTLGRRGNHQGLVLQLITSSLFTFTSYFYLAPPWRGSCPRRGLRGDYRKAATAAGAQIFCKPATSGASPAPDTLRESKK